MRLFDRELSQAKAYTHGTHRSRSPAETLAAYAPLMSAMGITRLANVTGLDYVGVPVYMCVRPNARRLAVSQGKGVDAAAARASALMEGIEIWHAENVDLPMIHGSMAGLRRHSRLVDIAALSGARPLADLIDRPRGWVMGSDLVSGEAIWVPVDVVELGVRAADDSTTTVSSSNGLASGNHLLEAIAAGLCEVIERDARALWCCDASDPEGLGSRVDLSTIDDPSCAGLIERIRGAGLVVGVQDITSDIGIPCYQCVVVERPGAVRPMGDHWGMGCHLDPAVALSRAVTEALQCRLTFIAGSRDDMTRRDHLASHDTAHTAALVEALERSGAPIDFRSRASLATPRFETDIEVILAALGRAGLEQAIAVDLSRPELGIPVVRVVVPGLEGACEDPARFVPGPRARRVLQAEARR